MNSKPGIVPSAEGQRMLETLRLAVAKVLERKRRLGQYAVIWQHGKPAMVNGEASHVAEDASTYAGRD